MLRWRRYIHRSVLLTPETEVGWEQSLEHFSDEEMKHKPFDVLLACFV